MEFNNGLEMKLYEHQKAPLKKLLAEVKGDKKRILFCANCSLGKTFMLLKIIQKLIKDGKRVAVVAYSRDEIRSHWLEEIIKHNLISLNDVQVVNGKNGNSVKVDEIDKKKPLTIFIPQSFGNGREDFLGKIDYLIIDEAHEYLEVDEKSTGLLKKIMKASFKRTSKLIGMTGTGHELVTGEFFNKEDKNVSIIVYDMPYALTTKAILPVEIIMSYFKFDLKESQYDKKGDLTCSGRKVVSDTKCLEHKVKTILQTYHKKGQKTLVIVPKGYGINTKISKFINVLYPKKCHIKSSHSNAEMNELSERLFRTGDSEFLVVVNMCNTGWNFPQLDNVVDLTFTKNHKSIIQRMGRASRPYLKKKPKYIYATDQRQLACDAYMNISLALVLTTKEGIMGSRTVYLDLEKIKEFDKAKREGNDVKIGSIKSFFEKGIISSTKKKVESSLDMSFNYKSLVAGNLYPYEAYLLKKINDLQVDGVHISEISKHQKEIRVFVDDLKNDGIIPIESKLFANKVKVKVRELWG